MNYSRYPVNERGRTATRLNIGRGRGGGGLGGGRSLQQIKNTIFTSC